MKKALFALLCLMLVFSSALAEDAAADLQARFGGETALTFGDTNYIPKKRVDALLFAANEGDSLLFAYLIAVDDDLDRISVVAVPPETVVSAPEGHTLGQIYARGANLDESSGDASPGEDRSIALLDAVNGLLPQPLIEDRLVLDAAGLDLLDGGGSADSAEDPAGSVKARLKAIYAEAQGMSSGRQMDLLDALSPYLATNVKTGAMMKIADKAQRYQILPTVSLPGSSADENQDAACFIPDESALLALCIETFYEENPW